MSNLRRNSTLVVGAVVVCFGLIIWSLGWCLSCCQQEKLSGKNIELKRQNVQNAVSGFAYTRILLTLRRHINSHSGRGKSHERWSYNVHLDTRKLLNLKVFKSKEKLKLLKWCVDWHSTIIRRKCCRQIQEKRRHVRRSVVLLATLALFVVCWFPLNILNLGEDLNMPLKNWRYSYTILQYTI